MSLWIVIAAILLITLAIVVIPLLRGKKAATADHDAVVYQDQLTEIDSDVERGLLSTTEAESLKSEINRRLDKTAAVETGDVKAGSFQLSIVIGIIVIVPLAALGLYQHLGSPGKPDLPFAGRNFAPPQSAAQAKAKAEMGRLVEALQKRMVQNPEKLDGWLLLGRSLVTMKRYQEASNAFKRAFLLDATRADVAASVAETAFMAAGGKIDRDARSYFEAARKLNPREHKALYYLGLDLAGRKKYGDAIQLWVDLIAISPVGAPWLDTVRRNLVDAAKAGNLKIADFSPRLKMPAGSQPSSAPGPTRDDIKAAQDMSDKDRQAFIRAMVGRLAERLKSAPEDIDGWRRLARAYQVLGETQKAADVNARIEILVKKLNK
tara:strand:- start:4567 stop:5700 length:1134 start_codon:yes stop_codon:yes gene_type:complete